MKTYILKPEVNEKTLANRGFNIITVGQNKIATIDALLNDGKERQQMLIFLTPPKRTLEWRYGSMKDVSFNPYIQGFIDLFLTSEPQSPSDVFTINEWAKEIHTNAVNHGFWEKEPEFGDICSLITTEVSEAYEEYRDHRPAFYLDEHGKPCGTAVEIIDVVIRCLDYLEGIGVDIEAYMHAKHEYNKTRTYKHGGKKI